MGKSVGKFGCSMEKWAILGLKRPKNMVLIGSKAIGGCIGESSQGKMGENGESGEKWGKVGGNGEKCGKFWMLDGQMGNLGAEKVKKHGFDWQQGYWGVHWLKLPRKNGGKWGKMWENGETKPVHPSPTLFVICPHLPPKHPISPHFLPFPPHFPPFPPISPHFPPFPPIFPGTGYIADTLLGILPPTSSGYF